MKVVLAIDQGTTGSRAILFDEHGRAVASAYQEFPQYYPEPGWVEQDPEEIWQSVASTVQRALEQAPQAELAAIGITNQRETTVVWDRVTGKALSRAIVWQCRRTAEACRKLSQRPGVAALIRRKTGLPLDAYFSASKLQWLLRNVPAVQTAARSKTLAFGTTDSWLLWKLTQGKVHATDPTNASRTMLFNLRTRAWDPELLRLFQIPPSALPEVKPSSGIFGKTAGLGSLPAGVPIAGVAGDQQAALFGQTCFEPGSVKNTYGTGCFLLMNVGKRLPRSKAGLIVTLGCDGHGRPSYVLEGAVFIAGAAIQWLRDSLKLLASASESEALARSLTSNDGVYFVPAFVGLGAPYWDSEARGTLTGLTQGTRPAHLVRAALEAMAYSTRDVLLAMEKDSGLKLKTLKIDGGAAANQFLGQFQADLLNLPVIKPRGTELTALGAAYLAGLAVRMWSGPAQLKQLWAEERRYLPNLPTALRKKYYSGWLQAVERTRNRA